MHTEQSNNNATWPYCFAVGALTAICVVLGHNIYATGGVFKLPEAVLCTAIEAIYLALWPPLAIGFLLVIAAATFGVRWLSFNYFATKRSRLVIAGVPIAFLLVANFISFLVDSNLSCKMGMWT
jgi:hypothetical protein